MGQAERTAPATDRSETTESASTMSAPVPSAKEGVKLSILGREFFVACADDQRESLDRAAGYLDEQMRTIRDSGKVMGMERCAIMAALNMSYELLDARGQAGDAGERDERLRRLAEKIDSVMADTQQVAL